MNELTICMKQIWRRTLKIKNRGKARFRQTQLLTRVEHKVRSSEQGVLSFHIISKRKCMYKGNTCVNELLVNFGTPPHDLGLLKYTKKRVILRQNSKSGQNLALSVLEGAPAWKITLPPVWWQHNYFGHIIMVISQGIIETIPDADLHPSNFIWNVNVSIPRRNCLGRVS